MTISSRIRQISFNLNYFFPKRDSFFRWVDRDELSATSYFDTYDHPSTMFFWKYVKKDPARVLEFGSNSGPKLFLHAKQNVGCEFVGVDLNQKAVDLGNKIARDANLGNLRLIKVNITDNQELSKLFRPNEFDLVFSFATLLCIHPKDIRGVIDAMVKLARNEIIIVEQHRSNFLSYLFKNGLPVPFQPTFSRNYKRLVEEALLANSKSLLSYREEDVPRNVWAPGGGLGKLLHFEFSGKY